MESNYNNKDFTIDFIGSITDINKDNIDVYVILKNGNKYTATFFTLKNIRGIMNTYKDTGECANATIIRKMRI